MKQNKSEKGKGEGQDKRGMKKKKKHMSQEEKYGRTQGESSKAEERKRIWKRVR